jgi:PST family polysaccharide transporter
MLYSAIGKSMLGRYAVYLANLLSMMLLARLITPEIFGTVASIMVFFVFFRLLAEAGLGPAIINLKMMDPTDRNGIFGLTLVAGFGLGILFYLFKSLFLTFYELPRIDEVVPYVAVALVFSSAAIVPNAILLRNQAFFRLANADLVAEVISTIASVVLLQIIEPLHALAAKASFSAAVNFSALYYFSKNTDLGLPRWGTKFTAIKPLLSFSLYQFGFNFINFFSRNLDNILIGKYLGAKSLGLYDQAYQLMRYPLMLLTFAMNPAIQPVLRSLAGDKEKVESIHRDFTFKLSLVGAAVGLGLFGLADCIVLIVLGPQWSGVVPIIRVLSIAIPVQVVMSSSGSFFQAMNRTDLLFLCGFIGAVFLVSAMIFGIYKRDMIVLSWGLVIAYHIGFFQTYYILYSRVFYKNTLVFLVRMVPASLLVLAMTLWL